MATPEMESSLAMAHQESGFAQGWPSEKWWELFEDPGLNQLIEAALESNPTLQRIFSYLGEAESLARKEQGKLFPHVNFNAIDDWEYFSKHNILKYFAPNIIPDSLNQIDMLFGFSYDLDLFGKNKKTYLSALGKAKAELAEYAHAKLLLTTCIAVSYFSLQCDLVKLEILSHLKETREKLIALTQSRTEKALDNSLQLIQAKEELPIIQMLLQTTENKVVLDRHLIASLLGRGPDDPLPIAIAPLPLDIEIPLPKSLSLDLLSRRADLMAELWRIDSAAYAVGVAKADFYPNINLMALAGLESIFWNQLLKWSSKTLSLIPSMLFPLYTGGELTANLNAKQKAFEAAIFSYNEKILSAVKEVADRTSTLLTLRKNLSSQKEKVELSEKLKNLTRSRLDHGLDTSLNLCQITEKVLLDDLEILHLKEQNLLTSVALIQALGGGYHVEPQKKPPLLQVQ